MGFESSQNVQFGCNPVGVPIVFEGYIDDFEHGIEVVQFSLDDGVSWTSYAADCACKELGVNWRFEYTPPLPGCYVLKVRGINKAGCVEGLVTNFAFEVVDVLTAEAEVVNASGSQSARTEILGSFRLRAIGGGALKGARLFRSAQLDDLSPNQTLFIANNLGIRTIYDVRTQAEFNANPEPYLVGLKSVHSIPATSRRRKNASGRLVAGVIGEYGAPEERMCANYRRYVEDYPLIGKVLRSIASENAPALIHCVNGKDRTGVISAIIMRIGGAHPDDVMADYLLTNRVNAAAIAADREALGMGMTPRRACHS